jgi:tRNA G18 (ribose-2'-O)-methylase SpoU
VPRLIPISDPADPSVAPYLAVRERDLAGRAGGFIAEGEVVLRVLARSPLVRARSLLIAEGRLARLTPLIERFADEIPVYVVNQTIMDDVVGFHIHRGVLAHGERLAESSAEDLLARLGLRARVVALFGVSNHDNVGGIFRNAAAFGADAVLLDSACCDPLYRKAIRVSVGAALSVPFARLPPGADPIALFERHGLTALALSPAGDAPLTRFMPPERAVILLGAEGPGLPDSLLRRAQTLAIPMAGAFDSLNVATTSGIVLHHLAFAG